MNESTQTEISEHPPLKKGGGGGFCIFKVTGEKAAKFLNGQLTNDIAAIAPGQSQYNLLLTVKGKIVSDLTVYRVDNDFYLSIPSPYAEAVVAHLKKLAPLSRVQITETHEKVIPQELKLPENLRIEQGIPKMGVDFTQDNLPQEVGLEKRAVSFTKGCFLGQEIVARLQYRGHVNKILVRLEIDAPAAPPPGTALLEEGKEVGKITSSAGRLALGYVPYGSKTGKEWPLAGISGRARLL
ncbi:MAG: hypothetical protein Q7T11_09365 [Deltaproteobacteria bacterium]|nr:hypothetical protein [Deltaproteobacteria bacterium]